MRTPDDQIQLSMFCDCGTMRAWCALEPGCGWTWCPACDDWMPVALRTCDLHPCAAGNHPIALQPDSPLN